MSMPTEYRIFLASSDELADDRARFAEMLRRRNDDWVGRGVHLRLVIWEDFVDAVSKTRLQDEYNAALRSCHVFVMLFFTQVGPYTEEEFDTACDQFRVSGKPLIYTYFKTAPVDPDADTSSRKAFQQRLKDMGHFQTRYANVEGLQLHFWQQLDKLVANGFIRFPADGEPGTGIQYQATNTGPGAIAQGPGSQAYGAGAAVIHGAASGIVNTGTITGLPPDAPRPRSQRSPRSPRRRS
jgi:hypothetical protein